MRTVSRLVLSAALLASLLPGAAGATSDREPVSRSTARIEQEGVHRLAGPDRYETAVALVRDQFETSPTVLLARGDDFPDALAASGLAARLNAPMLLTPPDGLHPATARELRRLKADQVVLLGGETALSADVADAVEDLDAEVLRIAGGDRHATAVRIAESAVAVGGGIDTVVLARSDAFADALAAAPLVAAADATLLLTTKGAVPDTTMAAIDDLLDQGDTVILAGGEGAISRRVAVELTAAGYDVDRIGGDTRQDTAVELARAAIDLGAGADEIVVSSARSFPDALAAGPVVIDRSGLLLLLPDGDLDDDAQPGSLLADLGDGVRSLVVAGGPVVVADDVLTDLDHLVHGAPETILTDASVVTMRDGDPTDRAGAVALRGSRIVAVGSETDVLALADEDTAIVPLREDAVLPGFVDAHTHVIGDRSRSGTPDADETLDQVVANGWTTLVELYVHQPRIDELVALDHTRRLPVRVEAYLPVRSPEGDQLDPPEYWNDYTPYEMLTDRVRVAGAKLTLDWVEETNYSLDHVRSIAEPLHDDGWSITMHAINPASATQAVTVLGDLLGGGPNVDRHRVEHLVDMTDEVIDGLAETDLIAGVQIGGTTGNLYNSERNREAYVDGQEDLFARWRDLDEAGVTMVGSTDAPWFLVPDEHPDEVVPPEDWQGFQMLHDTVTRDPMFGDPVPDWVREQALPLERAMQLLTVDGAHVLDREQEIGQLRPGFLADLVVATDDPLAVPLADVADIEVVLTMVGGESVHCTEDHPCPNPFARSRPLEVVAWDASARLPDHRANLAVDGDLDTSWISGEDPEQWIWLGLEDPARIDRMELWVDQDPAGPTRHRIVAEYGNGGFAELAVIEEETSHGQLLVLTAPPPGSTGSSQWDDIVAIKVETTASPSWPAWQEIVLFGTD